MPDRDRPSVPYAAGRVPTGAQRRTLPQVPDRQEHPQQDEPEETEEEMLARRLAGSGFAVEDIIRLGDLLQRKAVIATRQDEKLIRDQRAGLDQSQTIMSLTGELRRARWIIGLLTGLAGSVGALAASCSVGYQERKEEILEPVVRAEAKAARADEKVITVAATLDERLDASDKRVDAIEDALFDLGEALKANTRAVNGIAAKLDAEKKPGKVPR